MNKFLKAILVFILSFMLLNCADEKEQFTKTERELIDKTITDLQFAAAEFIQDNTVYLLFEMAAQLKDYSSFAYSMVIDPEGKVIAHSHPSKAIYKLDDEVTKKVLAYRNPSEIFIQKVKLDNRNALDFSLPVFSSSERSEYLGAVRLAMYLD